MTADETRRDLQQVQAMMQAAESRLVSLERTMLEVQQAIMTLQAMEAGDADGPVLVPVGAGVHVQAVLDRSAPVLLPVGSDTSLGATAPHAVAQLRQHAQKIQDSFGQASQEMEQLAQVAQSLQQRLMEAS